jgi:hypothetical protein
LVPEGGDAEGARWARDVDVARAMAERFSDWALTAEEEAALAVTHGVEALPRRGAGRPLRAHLVDALGGQPPEFVDLVASMLRKDPRARPRARDVLQSPGLRSAA